MVSADMQGKLFIAGCRLLAPRVTSARPDRTVVGATLNTDLDYALAVDVARYRGQQGVEEANASQWLWVANVW